MSEFYLGKKLIAESSPVFVIAEIGVNHNGSIELAQKLIDEAVAGGADCVKFQTFKAEQIVTHHSPKADYQLKVTDKNESQFSMLKKLELSFEAHVILKEYAEKKGVVFISTPYNLEDIDFLEKLGVSGFKIASGQLIEHPFLEYIAKKNRPLILSTGMGYLSDVDSAIRVIKGAGNKQLALLQCTTNYPSDESEVNLNVISSFKQSFGLITGYSDHTQSNIAIMGAVALGAKIIEKHFTLDKKMEGPDHSSSSEPKEFKQLVQEIRLMEKALGSFHKFPSPNEIKNSMGMRRSLFAKKDLSAGEVIGWDTVAFKRPASGLSPNELPMILGKKIKKSLKMDEPITRDSIEW